MLEEVDEQAAVGAAKQWAAGLEALHATIGPRFRRSEPRRRALSYLRGLLHPVERKNGWQLAEQAGERTPDGMQRLLDATEWDVDAVRDDLRAYVVEHFGQGRAVLVLDETGFLKKGTKSAGVQRQYSGTAGRIENCQVGVFLMYASPTGHAFLDRELYLPKAWMADQPRRREAGLPEAVEFRTKPQLGQLMLERALAARVPCAWVTADEIYGNDRRLRLWLEQQDLAHVLAVKSTEPLWVDTDRGPAQVAAAVIAAQIPTRAWRRLSVGQGSKGPRLYAWARFPIRPLKEPGRGYWLLVRRSLAHPAELAYYVCYGPSSVTLADLARVAGVRWSIEEGFERAKDDVGLDQYEVRRYTAWYRHITLALLAHAYLEVTRAEATADGP
jgi:SRSO17 transposase